MLILSRRVGEVIRIADEIEIMVIGIKGNQIKLGFTAPKNISVHREEIYQKILKEKESIDGNE